MADLLPPPTAPSTPGACSDSACLEEESADAADCNGDVETWGRNDNATHAHASTPLTYTFATAYDSCATGEWWQANRGVFVAQYAPGGSLRAGAYTYEAGDTAVTQYYVAAATPGGGADLRWSGTESPADASCEAGIAAAGPAGLRLGDAFPCPVPPPALPGKAWALLVP